MVKPLGLRVSRGMLQSLETYQEDPQGTHLALYVEPIEPDYSDAQYLKMFTTLTHKFVPAVFKRWKGLESFDICQEPVDDPREVPPPETQIFVMRSALDRVGNWKTANLTELLSASPRVRSVSSGYYVYFAPGLRDAVGRTRITFTVRYDMDPAKARTLTTALAQPLDLFAGKACILGRGDLALLVRQFRMPGMSARGAPNPPTLLTDGGVVSEISRIARRADEDHRTIGIIRPVNIVQLGLESETRLPPGDRKSVV